MSDILHEKIIKVVQVYNIFSSSPQLHFYLVHKSRIPIGDDLLNTENR